MVSGMSTRFLVLGAGFGGLEVASRLSDAFGADADVTLIDKNDGFVFGFSKFELMFGRADLRGVTHRYRDLIRPGVTFRQETIIAIDPVARRVTTDHSTYDADGLVVALGADYDTAATPGFIEGCHEFYSVAGALALRDVLAAFKGGSLIIGVLGHPFKCPPAPCEAAMLLDDWLVAQGSRANTTITLISPLETPIPPSPDASRTILDHFAGHGITYMANQKVTHLDPGAKTFSYGRRRHPSVRPVSRYSDPPGPNGRRRIRPGGGRLDSRWTRPTLAHAFRGYLPSVT